MGSLERIKMIQVYILIFSVFVAKSLNGEEIVGSNRMKLLPKGKGAGEEIQRITLPKDVVSNKIRLIPKGKGRIKLEDSEEERAWINAVKPKENIPLGGYCGGHLGRNYGTCAKDLLCIPEVFQYSESMRRCVTDNIDPSEPYSITFEQEFPIQSGIENGEDSSDLGTSEETESEENGNAEKEGKKEKKKKNIPVAGLCGKRATCAKGLKCRKISDNSRRCVPNELDSSETHRVILHDEFPVQSRRKEDVGSNRMKLIPKGR